MKNLLFVSVLVVSTHVIAAPRQIELKTEKIKDAVHWTPENVEVSPGEEVEFVVKHDLEGGFDFHGFSVPALKINEQINRHKPTKVAAKIPADLKPGEYPIGCQFHPKHVAAKLLVKKK